MKGMNREVIDTMYGKHLLIPTAGGVKLVCPSFTYPELLHIFPMQMKWDEVIKQAPRKVVEICEELSKFPPSTSAPHYLRWHNDELHHKVRSVVEVIGIELPTYDYARSKYISTVPENVDIGIGPKGIDVPEEHDTFEQALDRQIQWWNTNFNPLMK